MSIELPDLKEKPTATEMIDLISELSELPRLYNIATRLAFHYEKLSSVIEDEKSPFSTPFTDSKSGMGIPKR